MEYSFDHTDPRRDAFRRLFQGHMDTIDTLMQELTAWRRLLYTIPISSAESAAYLRVINAFDNALHSMEQLRNTVRAKYPEERP